MKSNPLTFGEIRQQIAEKHYATVPFSLDREEIGRVMESFMDFLTLSQEVKDQLVVTVDPAHPETEVGYRHRVRNTDGHLDDKEFFHYNQYGDEPFKALADQEPKIANFLAHARRVYDATLPVLQDILHSFDHQFPGIYERFFPVGLFPYVYIRFLKYNSAIPGSFLAAGHYDRGFCTLALAESAPGLRVGKNDQDLKEVVHKPGQALFMPALKLSKLTSDDFPPTWHDVVQRSEDVFRPGIARWALVVFADPLDGAEITSEDTHTPLY